MSRPLPLCLFFRLIFSTVLLFSVTFPAQSQTCECDHVINPPALRTTSVFIDGQQLGVKPGQTICVMSGFYKQIRLIRISGLPGSPVTIKNCGGLVQVGDSTDYGRWYALDIVSSAYMRVTGSGDAAYKYGMKLGQSGDSGLKIGLASHVEIDHMEIGNTGFAGIMAKTDYGGTPPPDAPEMNNLNIHDNYVHDTRGEGMYIGETKTPGMNFRHLEVWNNVVTRTGLDFFQVANVVEDVQVHHNVFHTAATRNVLYQNKGLQVGDNSVGRYYNNFVIGSPSNLMIIMGSGNIEVSNNYFSGAGDPGFFIDNRTVSLPGTPIKIADNFMADVVETFPFFKVYNEVNTFNIAGNTLDGNNVILSLGSGAGPNVTQSSNLREPVTRVQFTDIATGNFTLPSGSPYQGIGLLEDVSSRNQRPFISLIPDQEIEVKTQVEVPVSAADPDGDPIVLEGFDLPAFVSFKDNGNGNGLFILSPQVTDAGIYYKVRVRVTDSKGSMNTQYFTIRVLDPYAYTVTASSTLENNLPANTIDGDVATRWAPAPGTGHWIKYDLIEDKIITGVGISFFQGMSAVYPFDIEVSPDDSTWVRVFSGGSSGNTSDTETFLFEQARARYLRILDRSDSSISYNEVIINCTPAPVEHRGLSTDDLYVDGRKVIDNSYLLVKDQLRKSYVRFDIAGLNTTESPVISATLRIRAKASSFGRVTVHLGDHSNWSESNARSAALPSPVQVLDTLEANFVSGQVYEFDVTEAVAQNGVYTFIIRCEGSKSGVNFSSAEGGFCPELTIQTLRGAVARTGSTSARSTGSASANQVVLPDREISSARINVYPNPASEQVTVDLGAEPDGFVTIEVCDQVGRSLLRRQLEESSQLIDMNLEVLGMEPGLYLIKVKYEGAPLTTVRFVKQ